MWERDRCLMGVKLHMCGDIVTGWSMVDHLEHIQMQIFDIRSKMGRGGMVALCQLTVAL